MDWTTIWSGFVGMASALGVIAALVGTVEALFKPIRGAMEKRDRRIAQEARIARSLEKLDAHFHEAHRRDGQIKELTERMDKHKEQIEDSREERRILWQGMRAILQALCQLVPEDRILRDRLAEMDDYANKQMRK